MVDPTMSITNFAFGWEKDAPECSCKRNQKVFYICNKDDCPSRESQKTFCRLCFDDGKHLHFKPEYIANYLKNILAQWNTFNEKVDERVHVAQK